MNWVKGPETREKIAEHVEKFRALIPGFVKLAEMIISRGGDISFEWPSGCSLWDEPEIVDLLQRYSLNKVEMHGCAAGLRSDRSGLPVKKPWTIATTVRLPEGLF